MSVVVNFTGGSDAVYREDGTRLYGLDAELERKVTTTTTHTTHTATGTSKERQAMGEEPASLVGASNR